MSEYALLIDNEFKEIRRYQTKPEDISHKNITWHDVVREQGQTAFNGLENGNWVIRTALPTFSELKQQKLDRLASIRWEKETGGTTYNGYSIATDTISQTKYVGATVAALLDPTIRIKWKMTDGSFVELDEVGITAMAVTVRDHIQACFDRESSLRVLIETAVDQEELTAIDITVGWPV